MHRERPWPAGIRWMILQQKLINWQLQKCKELQRPSCQDQIEMLVEIQLPKQALSVSLIIFQIGALFIWILGIKQMFNIKIDCNYLPDSERKLTLKFTCLIEDPYFRKSVKVCLSIKTQNGLKPVFFQKRV